MVSCTCSHCLHPAAILAVPGHLVADHGLKPSQTDMEFCLLAQFFTVVKLLV